MTCDVNITDEHLVGVEGELTVVSPDVCPDHVICPQVVVDPFDLLIGRNTIRAQYSTVPRVRDWWRQRDDEFSPWSAWVLIHLGFAPNHDHFIGTGLTQGSTHDFQFRWLPGLLGVITGFPEEYPNCGLSVFRVTQGTIGDPVGTFFQFP